MSIFGDSQETDLSNLLQAIAKKSQQGRGRSHPPGRRNQEPLPGRINFPYSRHSSYPELCHFVETLKPKDVWPCTTSPSEWLKEGKYIHLDLQVRSCMTDRF
jgi:DNA cross-link repair 1C protein